MSQEKMYRSGEEILYSAGMWNISEWVRAARKHAKLTQEELGKSLGVTKGNVSGWENGRHEPGYRQLTKISGLTGYPLDIGDETLSPGEAYLQEARSSSPLLKAWDYEEELPALGLFLLVPGLRVEPADSSGSGTIKLAFSTAGAIPFPADFVRSLTTPPSLLSYLFQEDDSMEPLLFQNDKVMVDTTKFELIEGKIYAVLMQGRMKFRRIFLLPDGMAKLQCDNPKYPTLEVAKGTRGYQVLGRAIFRMGQGGF